MHAMSFFRCALLSKWLVKASFPAFKFKGQLFSYKKSFMILKIQMQLHKGKKKKLSEVNTEIWQWLLHFGPSIKGVQWC